MFALTYRAIHHSHQLLMKLRRQHSNEVSGDEDFKNLDPMAIELLEKIHHVIEDPRSHSYVECRKDKASTRSTRCWKSTTWFD